MAAKRDAQARLPDAFMPMGNVCPLCGTAVLVGERDAAGKWVCRHCRREQTEPASVPVLMVR